VTATLTLLVFVTWSGCCLPALNASAATEDPRQRAEELLELSDKQNSDDHVLAIQTAQESLALFQSVNDVVGIAKAHSQIGRCYLAQNATAEATQHYELALEIWRRQYNVQEQAEALINLGYVEGRKGEWLNGVSYFTQAHNLISQQNDPDRMGRIASGMGYFFNDSGAPEIGLTQYQRALEYFRQAQNPRYSDRMVMLIGFTYFLLGKYPESLTHLQQALASFESSPDPRKLDIAQCQEYLARIYMATGQYDVALQHLQPIPSVYKESGNLREMAQVEALIGQIYQQQGAIQRARTNYLQASRIFREVSDRLSEAAVRFALGRLELDSGNYEAAELYLKDSIENTENIRRDLDARVFAAAFSASVHERYEAYIECLMRKHKLAPSKGFDTMAFEASELVRARSLAELLRDTQTSVLAGADPKLAQKERSLRQAIRTEVDQIISLFARDYKKEELNRLETSLTRLREEHKQIMASLRQLNPNQDQIKEPPSYSLQQIQKLVLEDDQTVLLEYLLGQNASYVWAVTHNSARVFELPRSAVITEAVRSVYENVSVEHGSEPDSQLSKATAKLAEMILEPVAAQLTASRIIVVADDALNYIPFQLLPNPASKGEPLVAKYEIINVPSASILEQLRQEKQHRLPHTKILAAFGDPVFQSNYAQAKNSKSGEWVASVSDSSSRAARDLEVSADSLDPSLIQPLNYTKFELRNLSDIAGSESFVAKGFSASREVLGSLDLSKYAILHFATHGLLDPQKPERSGFFLSMVDTAGKPQDGFISMQDIYSLQAPVDLVVLSACRTGLGKNVRGEGLIGLTRGFMHAGASSVVASLWKVDDEATSELMKHFYANMLQKSMRPAEALRAAQNTLRQDAHWQSPHFWAGFTLQGEFKQPIRMPERKGASFAVQKTVGVGLLLALMAGIGWGYRRRRSTRRKFNYSTAKK
jgi:CHAT domain-containing protein/predicted negative regulator of RcsB-dependent stress response